jgi:tetratricopeptide (TPR) repeat protein
MLILLDDARDAAQVQPLLPGSASCSVLVTARGMLPELVGSKVIDLDVLPRPEARVLLGVVVGEERVAAEPAATEAVLSACAGLPLAVRIAGARLARRGGGTVQALADRLSDERRRLDELRMGNLAVRASFEVSFAALPGTGRPGELDPARAFRLLGLWTGPSIGLTAASSLLGEPEGAAADALSVLVDAHLLESPELDRYRFHDLLRVYAADRALTEESEADRREAINRVLTWYLHTAEAAARVISRQRKQVPLGRVPPVLRPLAFAALEEALAWCEHERPELMAATRLAARAGLHELAWQLPAAAMVFYQRRGHWADWLASHELGLASARAAGDRLAEAWMLNNLGMAYGVQRRDESVTYLEQALALSRELGNGPGEAQAATNLANTYFRLGNFAEARAAAQRSLDIERRVGNRFGEGIVLGILGCACQELGQYGEAIRFLEQALDISRELGDRDFEAETLTDLGAADLGLGRVTAAIGRMEESLAIRQDIGDRHGQAATAQKLGQAHWRAGHVGRARELLVQAIGLYDDLHDHTEAAKVRALLAALAAAGDGGMPSLASG